MFVEYVEEEKIKPFIKFFSTLSKSFLPKDNKIFSHINIIIVLKYIYIYIYFFFKYQIRMN